MTRLTIPMPLQIVVDDVGWWSGRDESRFNQPFRTGMSRNHLPRDYAALVRLGKGLGMKILAGFVLCEWDRDGILKELPSATWMGNEWSAYWVNEAHRQEASCIIKESGKYLEIALHAIGHEFWRDGKMERAEFHDHNCTMRDSGHVRQHLDFFLRIMDQHNFSPRPTVFIPPAMKHSFGHEDGGIQKLLREVGIERVINCFQKARQLAPPLYPTGTWENGVVILDRGLADFSWNAMACSPCFGFDKPFVVLHWANILHPDPEQNFNLVDRWVEFLLDGAKRHGVLLSRDVKTCFTQYLYRECSTICHQHNGFYINLAWRRTLPLNSLNPSFVVRVKGASPLALKLAGARVASITMERESFLLSLIPEDDHLYLNMDNTG